MRILTHSRHIWLLTCHLKSHPAKAKESSMPNLVQMLRYDTTYTYTRQKVKKKFMTQITEISEESRTNLSSMFKDGLKEQEKETGLSSYRGQEMEPGVRVSAFSQGPMWFESPFVTKRGSFLSATPIVGQKRRGKNKLKNCQQSNIKKWNQNCH